jgi:hypothetical protein
MFKPTPEDLELFAVIHDEVARSGNRNGAKVYGKRIFNPNPEVAQEEAPPNKLREIIRRFALSLVGPTAFNSKHLEYIDPIFTIQAEAPKDIRTLTMKSKTQAAWFLPSSTGEKMPLMQVDLSGSVDILEGCSLTAEAVLLTIKDSPNPHYQIDVRGAHGQTYFRREKLGQHGPITGVIRLGRSDDEEVLTEAQTQMLEARFFHQTLLRALDMLKMPLVAKSPRPPA